MSKHSIRTGSASSPSACCRPSSASTRCWRRRSALQLLLVEREPRVALGELEDAALVAALGGADLDRAAAALGQQLAQRVRSDRAAPRWHDHAAGSTARSRSTGA